MQADPLETRQILDHVTGENQKTRSELTIYTDRKIGEMTTTLETKGRNFINENFARFDQNIRDLALKIQIQASVTLLGIIILSQAVWYFIKRKLEKKEKATSRILQDTLYKEKYGFLPPKTIAEFEREQAQKYEIDETLNMKEDQKELASVDEIHEMIQNQRMQEEQKKLLKTDKQAEKEATKIRIAQEKRIREILKLQEKAERKTKGIKQKIEKLKGAELKW